MSGKALSRMRVTSRYERKDWLEPAVGRMREGKLCYKAERALLRAIDLELIFFL